MDLAFPFVENASDAVEARIRSDLGRVAREVGRADPHARALVLTGGFSRGEGTVRDGSPVNDYDLIALRARPGGGRLYGALSERLTQELGLHVDLLPVWRGRLPFVGRKLFWLDLRLGGRVIAGDPEALRTLRRLEPGDLPREEAARLLGNRAAGMLLSLPVPGETPDPAERDLQATKAILAAMDATLIAEGRYAPRMRDRLALVTGHPDHALFARAVEWKLTGQAALPAEHWDQAAECLLRAVDATGARGLRDPPSAHAFYALRARRLRLGPSRRVREAAWDMLAASRWPEAPSNGARVMQRLGMTEPTWIGVVTEPAWTRVKRRFFEIRAQTLQ